MVYAFGEVYRSLWFMIFYFPHRIHWCAWKVKKKKKNNTHTCISTADILLLVEMREYFVHICTLCWHLCWELVMNHISSCFILIFCWSAQNWWKRETKTKNCTVCRFDWCGAHMCAVRAEFWIISQRTVFRVFAKNNSSNALLSFLCERHHFNMRLVWFVHVRWDICVCLCECECVSVFFFLIRGVCSFHLVFA